MKIQTSLGLSVQILVLWPRALTQEDGWPAPNLPSEECDEAPPAHLVWGDGDEEENISIFSGEASLPAHLGRTLSLMGTLHSRKHVTGSQVFFEPRLSL